MRMLTSLFAKGRGRSARAGLAVVLLALAALWPTLASAAHTSLVCPAKSGTVANGGTVSINVTDCTPLGIGFAGIGAVDGPALPAHGSANLRITGPNWFVDYSHNGDTATSDFFEFTDASGNGGGQETVRVTITITPSTSPITLSPGTLPTMTAGTPLSQTLTSTGGLAPYSYTLQSGVLPVGLTLSSAGVLSGAPTQRGGYTFSVRSTDSTSPTAQFTDKGYTGTVQNPTLTLTTASGTAIQNVPFSQTLSTSGGVAPYSYMLETGSLPAGITVSSAGVVGGTTAAAPGNYPVTIRVTDASTGPGSYFEVENYTLTVSPPPSVSIAVTPVSVSEDGATNLTYTVTRSLNLTSPTVVNITTAGTATAGTDYSGNVATVTIPAGATTATITINPNVDGTLEPDETVTLILAAGTGYTIGAPGSATGTILNDDVPSVTVSVSPAAVAEDGAPNLIYTFTLNQAAFNPISINYTIGGTATNGTDYATIASPLIINTGNTTGTITVNPTADATIEADETVTLTLAAGTGYTVGVPNSATGTVLNDDLPNLTINDVTVTEGNSGITNAVFTVSLSAPAGPGGVTFNIATANGTATAGTDYVAQSLTGQTIPAGSSTYTFTVQVNGDTLNEPTETFFANVTGVANAVVVDGQGVGTISNDDPVPSLAIDDVTLVEGNSGTTNAVFTVSLSAASGQTVTVNYATADGTAGQPADYTSTSGTLTFTPGQATRTITVPVIGETAPEANETFFVNLSAATNATISDNQGVGTISNDDVPVTVSPGTLPNGMVATAYSQTITAAGGAAPYSFAVTAGALPAGLTLSPGGVLSGTPTAGGTFNFTATATDSSPLPGPFSGSQAYTLTIAPPTITLPATTLAGGTLGAAYSASIAPASGGTAPYAYAVTAGALPGGLALNPATGAITGTPSALGTFNFSITATDTSTGTGPFSATQAYAIVIADLPPIAANSSLVVPYGAPATNVPLSLSGGAAASLTITVAPTHGTALASGTTITYQPDAGYRGNDSFAYTATNSGGTSAPATVAITVQDPVVAISAGGSLAAAIATPYSVTFTFSGGTGPWGTYQVANLPAGLAITASTANAVTVSGTPTQAGTFALDVSGVDASTPPYPAHQAFTLTVDAPVLALSPGPGTLAATYAAPFSQAFTATGGIGPYAYALTGTLPAGMAFTGNTLAGTPLQPGNYSITITATDTGATGPGAPFQASNTYTLQVGAPTIAITPAALPGTTAGAAYLQSLTATGGVAPYTHAITAGSLPPGISLSNGGVLSGNATTTGTFAFTVTATDSNAQSGAQAYTIVVAVPVLAISPASLPGGTAGTPYLQVLAISGGIPPYAVSQSGTLPAGITFNAASRTFSGTPTQVGTFPLTVTVTDSTGGTPATLTVPYALAIVAPTLTLSPAAGTLVAPYAAPYSQAFVASGGVGPYAIALSGTLPDGMTFAGGTLSGSPTTPGNYPITVTATDTGSTGPGAPFTVSHAYVLTVPTPSITLDPPSLPAPIAATPYAGTVTASGGAAPYAFAVTAGGLPPGITLASDGTLAGTSNQVGDYVATISATDRHGLVGSRSYALSIAAPTLSMTPAAGTLPAPYAAPFSHAFTASGGSNAFSYALAGTLPAGLGFSGNTISGTPTAPGSYPITITATDAVLTGNGAPFSIARQYTIEVPAPTIAIAPATLPSTTAGLAYSQALSATGGSAPYAFAVTSGTLPNGLALSPDGSLSGTPTTSGAFDFTVTATDRFGQSANRTYTIVVAVPTLALTPATLPAGTAGTAYSQALTIAGGIAPYTVIQAGVLPTGITFNTTTRTFSGTPTQSGTFNISVTVTDSTGGTAATVTNAYTLAIAVPTLALTPAAGALPGGTGGTAYSQVFAAANGVAPYTYAVAAGTLPAGLSLNPASGALTGTPTVAGSFSFRIRATDSTTGTPAQVEQAYTLALAAPTIAIAPENLPAGMLGAPYDRTLTASGGAAPYRFALAAGSLPAGITLEPAGRLHGTPTVTGNFAVTVRATDALGFTGTRALTLVIDTRPDPSQDADVRGLLQAQIATTRRLADAQSSNFRNRMESLHGGAAPHGFDSSLSLVSGTGCVPDPQDRSGLRCPASTAHGPSATDEPMAAAPTAATPQHAFGAWIGGSLRSGTLDGKGAASEVDFETDGVSAGIDRRFSPTFAAGLGLGYGRDDSRIGEDDARLDAKAHTFAAYASYHPGQRLYIDALLGYQSLDYRMRRNAANGSAMQGQRKGSQWFASLTAGTTREASDAWSWTPYGRLDVSRASLDGYAESGDATYALRYDAMDVDGQTGSIGLRLDGAFASSWGRLQPQLRIEYQHDFQSDAFALIRYADGLGPIYRADFAGFDRNRFMLGAGLLLRTDRGWNTRFEYRGLVGSDSRDHGVNLTVEKGF